MAGVDIGGVVTAAIAAAAAQAAASPDNDLKQQDVHKVVSVAQDAAKPVVRELQSRIDYITNNENLVQSWSFTGGLTAAVGAIGTILEKLWDGYQPAVDNPGLILPVVTVLGAGVVLYGRLVASKPIGQ